MRLLTGSRLYILVFSRLLRYRYIILSLCLALGLFFAGKYFYTLLGQARVTPQDLLGFFGQSSSNLDETGGYTNFLVLGIRGAGTIDSPNLSDTILIFSYHHSDKTLTSLSLPRDLYLPEFQTKVNSMYHYGVIASPSGALEYTQSAFMASLGIPIHYTAVVSFDLFHTVIDYLGGLTVNISQGFTDSQYPLAGMENAYPIESRYETISFATGSSLMDGTLALKYVRSRMSHDSEGTDYSRNRRQQEVVKALKERLLSPGFMLDEKQVSGLIEVVNKQLITNITPDLYPILARLAFDTRDHPIRSLVLSDQVDEKGVSILYNPPLKEYKGEWVLVAKDKNYKALKQYLSDLLFPN